MSVGSSGDRSRSPRLKDTLNSKFDSALGLYLVKQWAWGQKSACHVQKEAALALADQNSLLTKLGLSTDFACKSLQGLAKIGCSGIHEQNCKRDLLRFLGSPQLPEPFVGAVPMKVVKPKDPLECEVALHDFPIIDPHAWFAWLYAKHRAVFAKQFLAGDLGAVTWIGFGRH